MESEVRSKAAAGVPHQPGRGLTGSGHHFLSALPRLDSSSRTDDLTAATKGAVAEIDTFWTGDRAPGVRLLITPGSQAVFREAAREGLLGTLSDAGAVVTPSTCGACGGGHLGILGPNETCITASTRNFKGRMGDPSARIYMASPATVAASAIRGVITDPREFLN